MRDAPPLRLAPGRGEILARRVDVDCAGGPGFEQGDVHRADAGADVDHGRVLHALGPYQIDELLGE